MVYTNFISGGSMGKKVKIGLIVFLVAIIAALSACLYYKKIVPFKHGIYWYTAEDITLNIEEDEIEKLDYFPNLKTVDLRESECFRAIANYADTHPNVDVKYTVILPDNITYDADTKLLDLTKLNEKETFDAGKDYLKYMANVETVSLNLKDWSVASLNEFQDTYKDVKLDGTFTIQDTEIPLDTNDVDISSFDEEARNTFVELVPTLVNLEHVNFGKEEDGHTLLSFVHDFQEENSDLNVDYQFNAFGKDIDYHATELDFNHITMYDQGEEVRELLENMPSVNYLDMDFCDVDNEHMAAIRDDYPDIDVVWRVWFGTNYSVRTDVEKILASAPYLGGELLPGNTEGLYYCTKVKYLDIGHNEHLGDVSFVKNMPDLEVLIIMYDAITDISPLASCKHLEFLEIFTNGISDISPLSDLKELKHLNMCYNWGIRDLSPIYDLDLERLWVGTTTSIPYYQIQEYQQLHPNCLINNTCGDPHTNWRWGTERYALLQQQLGYLELDYQIPANDPLYYPHD